MEEARPRNTNFSDELENKNAGRPFTDIWKYIRRGSSCGNGHYGGTCKFCNKNWTRAKPSSLRAHIANHCTGKDLPGEVRSHFIRIVAKENANENLFDSKAETSQYQKIPKKRKNNSSNIDDHFQKKEKLSNSRVEEIDSGLIKTFICCNIPFSVIENPVMVNCLKSLNANYDPPSRTCLTENLLKAEVAKVNARVNLVIEKSENLTIDKFFACKTLKYFYLF